MNLDQLNAIDENVVRTAFLNCCGSRRWCEQMLNYRPFVTIDDLLNKAEQSSRTLIAEDWKEAFSAHPKIGERKSDSNPQSQRWSEQEQSAAATKSASTTEELQRLNEEYYSRFGYIFIVCATGKAAEEILLMLKQRIHNPPDLELTVAADEQRKITRLRLQKLVAA